MKFLKYFNDFTDISDMTGNDSIVIYISSVVQKLCFLDILLIYISIVS